jgi:hypothetical protein
VNSGARVLATPCSQFLNLSLTVIGTSRPRPAGGTGAVGSFLSGALSWLVVVAVGLAPMLVYWLVRVIEPALRRKAPGPSAGSPPAEPEEGERGQQRDAAPLG